MHAAEVGLSANLRFALEARQPFGITGEGVRQHLERHVTVQLGVAGAVR